MGKLLELRDKSRREQHIKALLISMDVPKNVARYKAKSLLEHAPSLAVLDYRKGKYDLPPEQAMKIDIIGEDLLAGTRYRGLKFTVAATALSLLKEPIQSGYFKYLQDRVNYWTDGDAGKKFKQSLNK